MPGRLRRGARLEAAGYQGQQWRAKKTGACTAARLQEGNGERQDLLQGWRWGRGRSDLLLGTGWRWCCWEQSGHWLVSQGGVGEPGLHCLQSALLVGHVQGHVAATLQPGQGVQRHRLRSHLGVKGGSWGAFGTPTWSRGQEPRPRWRQQSSQRTDPSAGYGPRHLFLNPFRTLSTTFKLLYFLQCL